MMEFVVFVFGAAFGAAGIIGLGVFIHSKKETSKPKSGNIDTTKLVIARHYLRLIANRESIAEVRKIANKAIKETAYDR